MWHDNAWSRGTRGASIPKNNNRINYSSAHAGGGAIIPLTHLLRLPLASFVTVSSHMQSTRPNFSPTPSLVSQACPNRDR
jgi:hypothetical protein